MKMSLPLLPHRLSHFYEPTFSNNCPTKKQSPNLPRQRWCFIIICIMVDSHFCGQVVSSTPPSVNFLMHMHLLSDNQPTAHTGSLKVRCCRIFIIFIHNATKHINNFYVSPFFQTGQIRQLSYYYLHDDPTDPALLFSLSQILFTLCNCTWLTVGVTCLSRRLWAVVIVLDNCKASKRKQNVRRNGKNENKRSYAISCCENKAR